MLIALVLLSFLVRLVLLASQAPGAFFFGGDGPYYVQQGWLIAHHALANPQTKLGPLYPLLLALLWLLFPDAPNPLTAGVYPASYLTLLRLIQVVLGTLAVYLSYRIAWQVSRQRPAALVAALGVGLGPAFVLLPLYVLTEPVFMTLLLAAVWFYLQSLRHPSALRFGLAGTFLGLASLTRPVALLLPLLFLAHLLWIRRGRNWRKSLLPFLTATLILILPWMLYLYLETGNPFPEGLGANLWIGAAYEGKWTGTETTYYRSQEFGGERQDFLPEAVGIIESDPAAWLKLRTANLLQSIMIPYATGDLGGPSVKQALAAWWQGSRSFRAIKSIVSLPQFAPKLAIYIFHYFALVFGILGIAAALRRVRQAAIPVLLPIIYLLAVHGVLTALPRYLFPAEPFLWIFAGAGFAWMWDRVRSGGRLVRG